MITALNSANVSLVLSTILNQGLVQNFTVPNVVLNTLAYFHDNENQLKLLSEKVGVGETMLKTFLNQSMECGEAVKSGLPDVSVLTGLVFFDKLRVICFGLPPAIPPSLECPDADVSGLIFVIMFMIGFIFLLITSFTRQRHKLWTSHCNGYPGPVIPLNMLDKYENRWGFALAFGLTSFQCLNVLLSRYQAIYGMDIGRQLNALPSFTSILIKILSAILISLAAYPFFVCQSMKNRVFGSILGIFFSLSWLGMEIARFIIAMNTCWKWYEAQGFGEVFGIIKTTFDYPFYICLILLLCKFLYTLVTSLIQRQRRKRKGEHLRHWMFEDDTDWKTEYMYIHVQNLFKKVRKDENVEETMPSLKANNLKRRKDLKGKVSFVRKIVTSKVKSTLYAYIPEFKYSTRMVSSVFVTYIAMYHRSGSCCRILWLISNYNFSAEVTLFFAMYAYLMLLVINTVILETTFASFVAEFLNIEVAALKENVGAFTVSLWLGLATGLVFSILVMMNSLSWYRKHILMLRKGDYTFLPRPLRKKKFDSASLMVASMKFAGFQVSYAVWGFLILVLLLSLLYLLFITQIVFAITHNKLTFLLNLLLDLWPTILIAIAIYVIQYVSAIKLFLFNKQTLQVDNRRVYHILSYTMFYFNIFLGLVSCLLRIIFSIISGIIFLQRLQKSTLPRALELRDPGYASYVGYILLEHQHSNPVIQCFTRLLMESVHKKMSKEINFERTKDFETTKRGLMPPCGFLDNVDMKDVKTEMRRKKRILVRWHLFTILSLNPTLLKYRYKYSTKKYSLALFQNLNPSLYWSTNTVKTNDTDSDDVGGSGSPTDDILKDNINEILQQSDTNKKVGVRLHRSGTVLRITYTIDEGDNTTDELLDNDNNNRVLIDGDDEEIDNYGFQSDVDSKYNEKLEMVELGKLGKFTGHSTERNQDDVDDDTAAVQLIHYRKFSEMSNASEITVLSETSDDESQLTKIIETSEQEDICDGYNVDEKLLPTNNDKTLVDIPIDSMIQETDSTITNNFDDNGVMLLKNVERSNGNSNKGVLQTPNLSEVASHTRENGDVAVILDEEHVQTNQGNHVNLSFRSDEYSA